MTRVTEVVWLGRDNPTVREIFADTTPKDLTGVNRYVLKVGDAVLDSTQSPTAFQANGNRLTMTIGSAAGLVEGTHEAVLTLYESSYPNGLTIEPFLVRVRA